MKLSFQSQEPEKTTSVYRESAYNSDITMIDIRGLPGIEPGTSRTLSETVKMEIHQCLKGKKCEVLNHRDPYIMPLNHKPQLCGTLVDAIQFTIPNSKASQIAPFSDINEGANRSSIGRTPAAEVTEGVVP